MRYVTNEWGEVVNIDTNEVLSPGHPPDPPLFQFPPSWDTKGWGESDVKEQYKIWVNYLKDILVESSMWEEGSYFIRQPGGWRR